MKAAFVLSQTQTQTQTLSVRQQASLELLQMPLNELLTDMSFLAADNPLLEVDSSPVSTAGSAAPAAESPDEPSVTSPQAETPLEQAFEYIPSAETDDSWMERIAQPPSFKDALISELRCLRLTQSVRLRAGILVDELTGSGLLSGSLEHIATEYWPVLERDGLAVGEDAADEMPLWLAAQKALRRICAPGVGADSVTQSLTWQLEDATRTSPVDASLLDTAMRFIRLPLADIAKGATARNARTLGVTVEALRLAQGLVHSLRPYPLQEESATRTDFITPELVVRIEDGRALVFPVSDPLTQIRWVSEQQKARIRAELPPQMWQRYLSEASALLYSLEMRQNTLLRVARFMVGHQQRYFLEGENALLPLKMQDIADALEISISTVSRTVAGKYFISPAGTRALSDLLAQQAKTLPAAENTGADESPTTAAVLKAITEIVAAEPSGKPYSDARIEKALKERGFNVSRRTVTKYREQLQIPASYMRKQSA